MLLGARLLDDEDRSFEFLMEMINAGSTSSFAWDDQLRKQLVQWAEECFCDETLYCPKPQYGHSDITLRSDQSAVLREAALAIGSSVRSRSEINEQISTLRRAASEARGGRIVRYAPDEQRGQPEWIGGEIAHLFLRDDLALLCQFAACCGRALWAISPVPPRALRLRISIRALARCGGAAELTS